MVDFERKLLHMKLAKEAEVTILDFFGSEAVLIERLLFLLKDSILIFPEENEYLLNRAKRFGIGQKN